MVAESELLVATGDSYISTCSVLYKALNMCLGQLLMALNPGRLIGCLSMTFGVAPNSNVVHSLGGPIWDRWVLLCRIGKILHLLEIPMLDLFHISINDDSYDLLFDNHFFSLDQKTWLHVQIRARIGNNVSEFTTQTGWSILLFKS